MSENEAELLARHFFESQGFGVERISEVPREQRADYRVTDAETTYIVEVKGRIKDQEYEQELFRSGEAIRVDVLGRTNPVSKRIRDAAQQLAATPAGPHDFRVIALAAVGDEPDTQASQFKATLLGIVDIVIAGNDGEAIARPCFYFTFSEFFSLREVDAAIIIGSQGSQICLNTFSSRSASFRQTRLYQLHELHGAVIDPKEQEMRAEAYIADCDLDRRNEEPLLEYIKQKYNLMVALTFNPKKVTAAVVVKRPDLPDS